MARHRKLLGEVSLLGLGAFGAGMTPLTGALIGGGVAAGTSMTLGHIQGGRMAGNREMYGLLAGLGASGVLFAMKSTRHAAFGSVVGAILGSGVAFLEKKLLGTVAMPAAIVPQAIAGARVSYLNGLGITKVKALNGALGMRRQANGTYLNGLGMASVANQPQSVGTIPGVHGPAFAGTQMGGGSPVNLLGNASTRSQQVSLMGGPQIHGLSAAYGATLLGAGR